MFIFPNVDYFQLNFSFRNITPTSVEEIEHKSGSLKHKEQNKRRDQPNNACQLQRVYNATSTIHINVPFCNN